MGDSHNAQARCAEMVAIFGREWNLTPEQRAAYAQALVAYLPERYTEAQLQRLVLCYHLDHQEVRALRDPQHPGHQDAWSNWHDQVIRILRSANLDWLADGAIDFEDLTQIALEELNKSIVSYRFNSRLSTWAYTVTVRAGQRALRALRAAKRSGLAVSLDDPSVVAYSVDSMADPEASSRVRELNDLITAILAEQGGPRWVEIFQLRAHEDKRLVDIGRRLGLSTSRVSILLEQMRTLLRQHPDLLEWQELMKTDAEAANDAESEADSPHEAAKSEPGE